MLGNHRTNLEVVGTVTADPREEDLWGEVLRRAAERLEVGVDVHKLRQAEISHLDQSVLIIRYMNQRQRSFFKVIHSNGRCQDSLAFITGLASSCEQSRMFSGLRSRWQMFLA